MQKLERFVKQTIWISEVDGSEHPSERSCRNYEKDRAVKHLVKKLNVWKFWENYDIAPVRYHSLIVENLKADLFFWQEGHQSFLIAGSPNDLKSLWCKVSLRGNKMVLLLCSLEQQWEPQSWKFLGEVDLRQVHDQDSAKYYNATRTARIARQYENKQIQRRSGLSKLTLEEKKALNLTS